MKVRYTRTAEAELRAIYAYIADHNPRAAGAVMDRIERTVEWLREFPEMGRTVDLAGTRMIQAGRYPYLIFYDCDDKWITVRNVRHAKRRRPI